MTSGRPRGTPLLSIKELRSFASRLTQDDFKMQLGPFALVQKPPDENAAQPDVTRTVIRPRNASTTPTLLFEFDTLVVATLPPMSSDDAALSVGRLPDCELVLDHPSVSRLHAKIRWDETSQRAQLEDLKSSNGSTVNGIPVMRPTWLMDGDDLCFGDARFCYLLTASLYKNLAAKKQ
jgi:pSer/pThr/pTyr-binding forkhead associated (FHA) protein